MPLVVKEKVKQTGLCDNKKTMILICKTKCMYYVTLMLSINKP